MNFTDLPHNMLTYTTGDNIAKAPIMRKFITQTERRSVEFEEDVNKEETIEESKEKSVDHENHPIICVEEVSYPPSSSINNVSLRSEPE